MWGLRRWQGWFLGTTDLRSKKKQSSVRRVDMREEKYKFSFGSRNVRSRTKTLCEERRREGWSCSESSENLRKWLWGVEEGVVLRQRSKLVINLAWTLYPEEWLAPPHAAALVQAWRELVIRITRDWRFARWVWSVSFWGNMIIQSRSIRDCQIPIFYLHGEERQCSGGTCPRVPWEYGNSPEKGRERRRKAAWWS